MRVPEVGFKQWTSNVRSFTHTTCKLASVQEVKSGADFSTQDREKLLEAIEVNTNVKKKPNT
ncbi:MAG: hypothetical protein EAZ08_09165 [Cytophagales bacterium]|nr:MAG: hypothetical protein EAZ08_09165 [Cytophagales bacterium]